MSATSEFHIDCVCGAKSISASAVTRCSACGRILDASAWGSEPKEEA